MTLQVFKWDHTNADLDETPRVDVVDYGDGYNVSVSRGLNPIRQVWSLTFDDCEPRYVAQIRAFLIARGAKERFTWTNPFGDTIIVKCRGWKTSLDQRQVRMSMTFEQTFNVE